MAIGETGTGKTGERRQPTVVVAPTHGWNSTVRVSSHHLALAFAKRGWRVLFLATPVSPWHALMRRGDLAVLSLIHI